MSHQLSAYHQIIKGSPIQCFRQNLPKRKFAQKLKQSRFLLEIWKLNCLIMLHTARNRNSSSLSRNAGIWSNKLRYSSQDSTYRINIHVKCGKKTITYHQYPLLLYIRFLNFEDSYNQAFSFTRLYTQARDFLQFCKIREKLNKLKNTILPWTSKWY